MNRKYQMTVVVEFVDTVKDSAAIPTGAALRGASESLESVIAVAIGNDAPRSVSRKGVRVNVTRANLEVIE